MLIVRGILTALYFVINTTIWCAFIYPVVILKTIFRMKHFQNACTDIIVKFAESWCACNNFALKTNQKMQWIVNSNVEFKLDRSYLVIANHQSWVDILMLQKVFNREIPFLRFFLKQELLYVPLLGGAWWGLDYPFMKRYSKSYLEKHPEKRGEDFKTVRKTCEKLRGKNISILNFIEGTRYTAKKHAQQNSTYTNLLNPKTGGIAFVLEAMGTQFYSVLDVAIHYPQGIPSLWNLLCGKISQVVLSIDEVFIPQELLGGSYLDDPVFRKKMQNWVHAIWQKKDQIVKRTQEHF